MGETVGGEVDVAILGQVADGDLGHLDLDSRPALDGFAVAFDQAHEGRTDVAAAEQPDPHHPSAVSDLFCGGHPPTPGFGCGQRHSSSRRSRSSKVSRRTTGRASPPPTKTTAGRGTLL